MRFAICSAGLYGRVFNRIATQSSNPEMLFENAGLNPALLYEAKGAVPVFAFETLLHEVASEFGHTPTLFDDLGFGGGPVAQAALAEALKNSCVALDVLKGMVRIINTHLYGMYFYVQVDEDCVWIKRLANRGTHTRDFISTQFQLAGIARTLRFVFGEVAQPVKEELSVDRVNGCLPDYLQDVPITTRSTQCGIAFSTSLLTFDISKLDRFRSTRSSEISPLTGQVQDLVVEAAGKLLLTEAPQNYVERLARGFGLSSSSYGRVLKEIGLSHRSVLREARLKRAIELLRQSPYSITQIAYELGFQFPGDFTRFFRSCTGISPRDYRSNVLQHN